LTEADWFGAAIQDSGLSIESERPKLVRGRHCWIAKKFGKILELFMSISRLASPGPTRFSWRDCQQQLSGE
jgi:hypothetical protein